MTARSPIQPPWAIYPLPPIICANLIVDIAVYFVTVSRTSAGPQLQATSNGQDRVAEGGRDAEEATAAHGPVSPVSLSPEPRGQRQLMPQTAGSAIADGLHRAAALRFACIALLGRYR